MGYYFRNMETGKLEMHFDKEEYLALTDEQKQEIKSNFLFSRYSSAWISRAKFPNLFFAEKVAERLGLESKGKQGERLTFEEQQERKAERAEIRADRMEYKAEKAEKRGEALQKPINDMHGDIAFFTQPNINTSGGRAFTRKRDRMWSAWEQGMEEFKKSEYYQHRAEIARKSADKPTDKAFCERRIAEANKTIKAQTKNIESYKSTLEKIENGKTPTRYNGDPYTADEVNGWIENAEEMIETAIEKVIYYQTIIDDLGGIQFSKENIKAGYIIKVKRYGLAKVVSCGTKNVKARVLDSNWEWSFSYAEILEVVKAEEQTEIEHPFRVGDEYTVEEWDSTVGKHVPKVYKVTKVTVDKVTVKSGNERAKAIRPRKGQGYCKNEWYLTINDGFRGYVTKTTA